MATTTLSPWLTFRASPELARALRGLAHTHDRSLSSEIRVACKRYIDSQNDEGAAAGANVPGRAVKEPADEPS
jgi:predicted DNA-binding ribbon-helix-helix protein